MTTTVRFLGTTDEHTTCDCCGKSRLKHTVAIELSCGDVVYYGATCAARSINMVATDVHAATRVADRAKEAAAKAAEHAAWTARDLDWQAALDRAVPSLRGHRLAQIQSLGGMVAARVAILSGRI